MRNFDLVSGNGGYRNVSTERRSLSDTLLIHDTCVGPTANKVTSRRPIYAPKARGE